MMRFWSKQHDDPIAALLEANRPEPRDQLVAGVLERIEAPRRRLVGRPSRHRLAVALAVTALSVVGAASAGAAGGVSTGLGSLYNLARQTVAFHPATVSQSPTSGNQQVVNAIVSSGERSRVR